MREKKEYERSVFLCERERESKREIEIKIGIEGKRG